MYCQQLIGPKVELALPHDKCHQINANPLVKVQWVVVVWVELRMIIFVGPHQIKKKATTNFELWVGHYNMLKS